MRAITLRFPRGGPGLPARIGSALVRRAAGMRDGGRALASLPALARAETLLAAHPLRGVPKRRLRVPDGATVSLAPPPGPLPPAPAASANDNRTPARARPGLAARDLVFLAALFATVAGAYWQGRLHGYQKIIVVPGPSLPGSKVT